MKTSLLKLLLFVTVISATSYSEVPVDSFSQIDAFTSATIYHSCTLFTSKIYKDKAVFYWWEDWPKDNKLRDYKIKWGTEEGVYIDSIDIFNNWVDSIYHESVLNGLQPGTKYYGNIYRDWNGELFNRPFVFTTPPLDPIPPVPEDDLGYIGYQILAPTHVTFPRQVLPAASLKEISSVKVTTISGREVSRFPYVSIQNTESTINSSKLVPGLYIATFLNKKRSAVSSTRFLIN